MTIKVLFVCLGNICRSPTAHGVFEQQVKQAGLSAQISVDSAGTGDWNLGNAPDKRASATAKSRNYDLSSLRARLVTSEDFNQADYILAMDNSNLSDLQMMCPDSYSGKLALLLSYTDSFSETEVPDPYYGEGEGFNLVFDMVEAASAGLLAEIKVRLAS
jgi:protein-tyrosine phosphatase